MFVLDGGLGKVEALAFGPDSRAVAVSCTEGGLLLWRDLLGGGGPQVLGLPGTNPVGAVRFAPDGRRIEWRGPSVLAVFDAGSGERVALVQPPVHNFTAALVADGTSLLVSRLLSSAPESRSQLERLSLADPRPESALWSVAFPGLVWDDPLFLPDGRTALLLVLRRNANRTRWEALLVGRELATGRELWSSPPDASDSAPRFPSLSADGRLVAAWAAASLTTWRADDPQQAPVRIKNEGRKHFTGIAFHPSGRYLAATSNDATVKLYDTGTWQMVRAFAWEIGRLRSVAFSPDGCRAAVGSDQGTVLVWDVDL